MADDPDKTPGRKPRKRKSPAKKTAKASGKAKAGNGRDKEPKPQLPPSLTVLQSYTGDIPDDPVMGRPTKYTPEAGARLIAIMRDGYTATAAAGAMGIHRDTLYEWAKKHPDFSDALKRGHALRQFRLETQLLMALDGPSVRAAETALKTSGAPEWRDGEKLDPLGAPEENPLATLARQLIGTSLKPRALPPPEPIDAEYTDITNQQPGDEPPPRPMQGGA